MESWCSLCHVALKFQPQTSCWCCAEMASDLVHFIYPVCFRNQPSIEHIFFIYFDASGDGRALYLRL